MAATSWEYHVAIVGGGSGGYAAARTAGAAGLKTAVIEGGDEVGGLCILRGCMPTKALLFASEVMHLARHAGTWGVVVEKPGQDFARVMARKNTLIKEFADDRAGQLQGGPFDFIRAQARFIDAHTLSLSDGRRLTAAHFVVSTGSVVSPPPLPALAQVGYLDSDKAMKLQWLPESLIVLGGGAVAMEFTQFFARFGVKVTVVQRGPRVLKDFDEDAAAALEAVLRREGVEIYTGTRLIDAWKDGNKKGVAFEHAGGKTRVVAEEIFHGLGRTPNTGSLDLGRAGVALKGAGIVADLSQRTSAPHIYAAGDCTGPHEVVHLAILQGEVAAHNIAHPEAPRRMDYRLLTAVVFTEPQVAVVGLTENEARERKIPYVAASHPFSDHGKSLIMEAKDGFVKLLADPASGEILGGCCAGPLGGELIHEVIAAMHKRMTVHELAAMPHYHPTLAEIWTYPAEELARSIPVR